MKNLLLLLCIYSVFAFSEEQKHYAVVLQDQVALRPAPRASARPNALLWQGETLEVRGERLDYLQVWDYTRERGGYVRASQVRRLALSAEETPELLAVLRLLRDLPGSEALGIGIAAAYIEAAPPAVLNGPDGVAVLEAMGALAERLARQAMATRLQKAAAVSAHLDVAASYGVRFVTLETNGRMRLCYDGAAYRKILVLHATDEQRVRAMLALSDPACTKPDLTLAELLDAAEEAKLPAYLRSRMLVRRAALWSSIAYQRARKGEDGAEAAERALKSLAAVDGNELADADRRAHAEAKLRAAASGVALAKPVAAQPIQVTATAADDGRTCIALRSPKGEELARRCTYGLVWPASAVANRDGTALALAVQPVDGWRELWLFRKQKAGWTLRVMPPAATPPGVGIAEFAGWAPGRVRVSRAALVGGELRQSLQLVRTAR